MGNNGASRRQVLASGALNNFTNAGFWNRINERLRRKLTEKIRKVRPFQAPGKYSPRLCGKCIAQRAFFSSESFDHVVERWLVWLDGGRVVARAFVNGRRTEGSLEAPLPAGVRMVGSALDHGRDRIRRLDPVTPARYRPEGRGAYS